MFDEEIIKRELMECVDSTMNVDIDDVITNFTMFKGLYMFRIGNDAHIFNENTFVDSFPGFFTQNEGDTIGR